VVFLSRVTFGLDISMSARYSRAADYDPFARMDRSYVGAAWLVRLRAALVFYVIVLDPTGQSRQ